MQFLQAKGELQKPSIQIDKSAAGTTKVQFMDDDFDVFGVQWDEFISALTDGRLQRPFLVRVMEEGEKASWRLYAVAPKTVVTVNTFHHERRSWRTLDGALSDMERKMDSTFPALRIYSSQANVPPESLSWVALERRLM